MLVIFSMSVICHQHLKGATNIFRLQYLSPTFQKAIKIEKLTGKVYGISLVAQNLPFRSILPTTFSRSLFLITIFLNFVLLDLQELSRSSRYFNEFQVHSSSLFQNSKSEFILLLFIQRATLRVTVMPLNL